MGCESFGVVRFDPSFKVKQGEPNLKVLITRLLCPPQWGVDILFLLFPASGRLVSAHLKEKYLSYLYQIWHGCLLG